MEKKIVIRNIERVWGIILLLVPVMVVREAYLFFTGAEVRAVYFVLYSLLFSVEILLSAVSKIFPDKKFSWKSKNGSETTLEFTSDKK